VSGGRVAPVLGLIVVVVVVVIVHRPGGAGAQAAMSTAQRTFLSDCAVCHGERGTGTANGPSLIGVGAAAIDYQLSTGRMPLDPIKPEQTSRRRPPQYDPALQAQLVEYISALTGPGPAIPAIDPAQGDLAQGGEIFRLNCAACHAWAGDGGALLHREAPPLHDATPVQIAEAVRVGPTAMPAFGTAAIPDSDLNSLVRYVRYLDHPEDHGGNPLWHLGPVAEGFIAWAFAMALLIVATRWIGDRT
jgi:ubiquinol-cytochrome c reductase cytochrome c subunit